MNHSRIPHLRVKIISLADEARTIRREEKKALADDGGWRRWSWSGRRWEPCSRTTPEAQNSQYQSLREHRIGAVRRAARCAQLAYGFLRGRPYAVIEQKTSKAVDFREILKNAKRFADPGALDGWEEWQSAAISHLKEQGTDYKAAAREKEVAA